MTTNWQLNDRHNRQTDSRRFPEPTTERSVGVPREPVPARVEAEGDGDLQDEGEDHEAVGRKVRKQRRWVKDRILRELGLPDPGSGNVQPLHQTRWNGQNQVED